MAQGYDEGVGKLDEFNALLAETNNQLQADRASLESLEEAIETFEDTVEETLGGANDAVATFLGELDEARADAADEVRRLADSARRHAEGGLSGAGDEVEQAGGDLGESLDGNRRDLEHAWAEVIDRGFEPLHGTLDETHGEADDLRTRLEESFELVEEALAGGTQRLQQAHDSAEDEMEEAAAELAAAEHDALEEDSGVCLEGWSTELPTLLESQSAEIGDPLEQAYGDFESEAVETGTAITQGFADLVREAADLVGTEIGPGLQEAVDEVAGEAMESLAGELTAGLAVLAVAEDIAGELGPMVEQLVIVRGVVEEVERLLAAVE